MWRKGPQPLPEISPSPAQAGCVTSNERAGDRAVPWLCLWIVLIAEFDERRPVQVFHSQRAASSPKNPPGSGHPASRSGGERTPEAGSVVETSRPGARLPEIPCLAVERSASQARRRVRRKPKRRRQHSSMEGVLVLPKPSLLTRRRWRWNLAACLGLSVKSGPDRWLRQRTSEATQRARCAVENAVTGRPSAEELRSKLHQACAGSSPGLASESRL